MVVGDPLTRLSLDLHRIEELMADSESLVEVECALVVDVDGTLVRSDLLIESFFSLVSTDAWRGLRSLAALVRGRAAFKARVAEEGKLDVELLPLDTALVRYLSEAKQRGTKIYLASASDRRLVASLAERLGIIDGIFASDGQRNLAGRNKAQVLCDAFGEGGFDYVGNSAPDLAVWSKARRVYLVDVSPRLRRRVLRRFPHAQEIASQPNRLVDYVKALRIHQWLKNLLIFAPALAAHDVRTSNFPALVTAFISFSLCASSVYLLNDLLDLSSDRRHSSKRLRPFAAGKVPLLHGIGMTAGTLVAALIFALRLPSNFLAVLGGYFVATFLYSIWLKRKLTIDLITLASLYGVRLVAGAVAMAVPLSSWFVAFAFFLFFSLATVKRCTELVNSAEAQKRDIAGRGYELRDLPVLEGLAAASGFVAVMVFILYVSSPAVAALYRHPERLWFAGVVLMYWISRVLILTHRGWMHDDPLVFAAKDWKSIACAAFIGLVILISI